mmetsp:Transcript_11035/g.16251  ORF Transcript_11035/g.16251 Transcript_11035/m.16251 type:complete len:269 (-) Transcript_11035:105-911(-)
MPINCSSESLIGLPFIELLRPEACTISGYESAETPKAPRPGTPKSRTRASSQAAPFPASAPSSPVMMRATSSCLLRALIVSGLSGASDKALTLARKTWGNRAAHTAPWGASNFPPMTPANPCTAPSLAFARDMPPSREAIAKSSRASRFAGWRQAVRRERAARRAPSLARASVMGVPRWDTRGSMHWVRASRPECAVTVAGADTMRAGSTRATAGIIRGLRSDTFTPWAVLRTTLFFVTSLPVPAVVGTATQGRGRASSGCPFPTTSR